MKFRDDSLRVNEIGQKQEAKMIFFLSFYYVATVTYCTSSNIGTCVG